jgi:hypothetical protein
MNLMTTIGIVAFHSKAIALANEFEKRFRRVAQKGSDITLPVDTGVKFRVRAIAHRLEPSVWEFIGPEAITVSLLFRPGSRIRWARQLDHA